MAQLLKVLPKQPEILWLTPRSLDEIFDNVRQLGEATGRVEEAEQLMAAGRERLAKLAAITSDLPARPRVFCMEWLDPVYCSGHWMPEMVALAGGVDELGRAGSDSVRIPWTDVVAVGAGSFDRDTVWVQSRQGH